MTDWDALLRDDPQAFVRELRRGAQQGAALAAARPGLEDVGAALEQVHDRFAEALWEPQRPDAVERSVLRPRDDSAGAKFTDELNEVNPDNGLVLEVADGYATALRDHMLGLARLASAGGPARSMLALARVLLDASVHLTFLMDTSLGDRERCSRALNIRLEALRQEIADAQDDPDAQREVTSERERLLEAAQVDGFERELVKNGKSGTTRPGWFVTPHDRFDAVMRSAIGDNEMDSWRTLSSVVHAQERPSVRFPLGLGEILPGPHATQMTLLFACLPVFLGVEAMRAAERFYGTTGVSVDDDGVADKAIRTVAAASGMHDDLIRRRLGFE